MNHRRFEGSVALVTGAAQGIGLATARQLAREGALVIVADRAAEPAMAAAHSIAAAGGNAVHAVHDLEHRRGAVDLIAEIDRKFGRVDVAVHNVGGTIWTKPFWEYAEDEIVAEIQRSLWPTLWGCHAVLPVMLRQGTGAIVNVGSVATRGVNRVPYAAAKGGVAAITAALSLELGTSGVRVNCVAPGGVDVGTRVTPRNTTPLSDADMRGMKGVVDQTLRDTPLGRFGKPEEIAAAICFLASSEASYITGQTLYAAGGGIG